MHFAAFYRLGKYFKVFQIAQRFHLLIMIAFYYLQNIFVQVKCHIQVCSAIISQFCLLEILKKIYPENMLVPKNIDYCRK